MAEKGAVVSKQQLSYEFLYFFSACEGTPKVDEIAVSSETDIDAVLQVLFCLTEHDAEEDGEQFRGHEASPLDAVGDGDAVRQRPILLHLTFLIFMELAVVSSLGGQPRRERNFHSPSRLTVSKALVRPTKAAFRSKLCSLPFPCICLGTKFTCAVLLSDPNPHWFSGVFSCAIVGISLFSKTRAMREKLRAE